MKTNSLTTSNFMILSALSCITLTANELPSTISWQQPDENSMPSMESFTYPGVNACNYYINNQNISTETIIVNTDYEDYKIISSFANKILMETTFIDKDIQDVIINHFWDML